MKWVNNFTENNWAEGRVYKGNDWLEKYQGKDFNKKEKHMNWITTRLKEKSSQGGLGLVRSEEHTSELQSRQSRMPSSA